jgi:hypothetical protein
MGNGLNKIPKYKKRAMEKKKVVVFTGVLH